MLTLGSAGVMNHAMSGLVLIYTRALHKGDWIHIADNEGQVSEIGMLATKILTRENYIVTLPNAVVVAKEDWYTAPAVAPQEGDR